MSDILSSTAAQYIPAAASALGSGGVGIFGSYMNYMYNRSLSAQQNAFNLDMWNRTNEYNSPQAQMQRFKEAGLNPNLIYGRGESGNASGAPQMVVPNAPDFTKGMQKMAESFNVENLLTTIANRKKAEAEASQEKTHAYMLHDEYEGMKKFGESAYYDPSTGKFGFVSPYKQYINDGGPNPYGFYKMMDFLSRNYRGTELIPYRAALLDQQKNYLIPQVSMANYESKYFPVSYWIGTGAKVAKGIGDIVGIFNPLKKGFKKPPTTYYSTKNYYYY